MDPLAEYESRRGRWLAKQALLERKFILIGNWRLAVAVGAAILAWLAFGTGLLSGWFLLMPLAVFIVLVAWHAQVVRGRTFATRGVHYYDRGSARLKGQWQGKGETGERFRDANHVYAEDLDLFGRGGVFELLCTARTAAGEDALAGWLLNPTTHDEAKARQEAVNELSARLDLREELALLGEDVRSQVRADVLTRWGLRPPVPFNAALPPLCLFLSVSVVIYTLGTLFEIFPNWPLVLLLLANAAILRATKQQLQWILAGVDMPASHLAILRLLIQRAEKEEFESSALRGLLDRLRVGGLPAALQIRRFERWIEMLGMSSHYLMRVVNWGLLWKLQIALAIERWRRKSGPHLGEWIRALGEFEALSALATLKYERPKWTFPELLPQASAHFAAKELRHPLIPEGRSIANDIELNEPRLFIVSGSNMSGKSTLLRTIGLNTVLAWAGAPVNASSLKLSPLRTGASIRVTDSLQDNRSRFYAEIMRLRQIVDLTKGAQPVLFLLDELLSGTNSHDRRIGAAGLVKGLLRGSTIGLLTTHDLALAEIANEVASAANVHFEDRITGGQVEFDYRLRPGVVTHSNALELMRAVGLEV